MPQLMPSHALPASQLLFKGQLDQLSPGGWPWSGQLWAETSARGLCCPVSVALLMLWPCAHPATEALAFALLGCPPGWLPNTSGQTVSPVAVGA